MASEAFPRLRNSALRERRASGSRVVSVPREFSNSPPPAAESDENTGGTATRGQECRPTPAAAFPFLRRQGRVPVYRSAKRMYSFAVSDDHLAVTPLYTGSRSRMASSNETPK